MARNGPKPHTQIYEAREGVVTDAMRRVAERENLPPEVVREEVARGRRQVLPRQVEHHGGPAQVFLVRLVSRLHQGAQPTPAQLLGVNVLRGFLRASTGEVVLLGDRDPALPYAYEALEDLRGEVGHTTHYARRDGAHVLYLASRDRRDSVRLFSREARRT